MISKLLFGATILVLTIISVESYAHEDLRGRAFLHRYANGSAYIVRYENDTVTWCGKNGSDTGRQETDAYQAIKVSSDNYLVQWAEADGTVVHLSLNLKYARVGASVSFGEGIQLIPGVVLEITPLTPRTPEYQCQPKSDSVSLATDQLSDRRAEMIVTGVDADELVKVLKNTIAQDDQTFFKTSGLHISCEHTGYLPYCQIQGAVAPRQSNQGLVLDFLGVTASSLYDALNVTAAEHYEPSGNGGRLVERKAFRTSTGRLVIVCQRDKRQTTCQIQAKKLNIRN